MGRKPQINVQMSSENLEQMSNILNDSLDNPQNKQICLDESSQHSFDVELSLSEVIMLTILINSPFCLRSE